jgi:hypothetical protein
LAQEHSNKYAEDTAVDDYKHGMDPIYAAEVEICLRNNFNLKPHEILKHLIRKANDPEFPQFKIERCPILDKVQSLK